MEKRIKTVVCLLLLLSVVLSMASCGIFGIGKQNDGKRYTGGFSIESHFYIHREIHWLETFDEAMTAIEHLRAAGNDLPNIYIAGYENETVDAKYLIMVNDYRTPKQKEGEEWYDRKFNKVEKIGLTPPTEILIKKENIEVELKEFKQELKAFKKVAKLIK